MKIWDTFSIEAPFVSKEKPLFSIVRIAFQAKTPPIRLKGTIANGIIWRKAKMSSRAKAPMSILRIKI